MYGDVDFDKDQAFMLMGLLGYSKAVVEYSGGNDEGGVDEITASRADGTSVRLKESYDEGKTDEERLTIQLCQPVYDEWHSFAGEFYVHGTLTYDVATRKVLKQQDVETPSTESEEEEL